MQNYVVRSFVGIKMGLHSLTKGDKTRYKTCRGLKDNRISRSNCIYASRGDHRLKQYEQAEKDLNFAIQHKSQRLRAWINCVLLDAEMGEDQSLAQVARAMKQKNPSLWCDAVQHAQREKAQDLEI